MTRAGLLDDGHWAEGKGSKALLIGLTTFGLLALELALIRWTSSQVRVFAYFNNMVLIGSFLGIGLGSAMGRRYPGLVHFAMPVLLVFSRAMGHGRSERSVKTAVRRAGLAEDFECK